MKTTIKVYEIGTKVFAIAQMIAKDSDCPYIAILEAVVHDASYSLDEESNTNVIEYWLKTPNGEDWGDGDVKSIHVSHNFNDLVKYIKPIWLSHSNTH